MNYNCVCFQTVILLGGNKFRVLSCKVFGKNTTRPKGGVEIFFKTRRAKTLLDKTDTELLLSNEIIVWAGLLFFHSKPNSYD